MLNKIRNFKLLLEFCIYDFYFGKVKLLVDHFEEKETGYQTSYFACTVTSLQHGQLPACFYSELRKSEYKRRVWNPSEVHGLGSYFKRRVTLFEKGMYPPMKGVSVRAREGKRSTLLRTTYKTFFPKILLKESNSLILSYRIISHGILSYPMVSYRTLWYPIESHGILRIISYPTVFYHIPWYPMVSHPIPTLSHPIVLYLIVLYCYYIVHNFCKTLRWCGYPE